MKTNKDFIVMQSVQGKISSPRSSFPYRIDREGNGHILPATGGITYNVSVGDLCMGWIGDHIEPGVSIKNDVNEENTALNILSCIGNKAKVLTGDAKGKEGYVTGKHGGINHVLIYFNKNVLENLAINDVILVKAHGQGLAIEGYEDIKCMNIDPYLLDKLGIEISREGYLQIPIVTVIPSFLMGSGIGETSSFMGDYDIMTGDIEANTQYGIENLRFGDIVLLQDCDNTYGRQYIKGAVSIGVIVHSDCIKSGHGPGVTVIMSCKKGKIKGIIDKNANIANYLEI